MVLIEIITLENQKNKKPKKKQKKSTLRWVFCFFLGGFFWVGFFTANPGTYRSGPHPGWGESSTRSRRPPAQQRGTAHCKRVTIEIFRLLLELEI